MAKGWSDLDQGRGQIRQGCQCLIQENERA
jgi:hypothetical protein